MQPQERDPLYDAMRGMSAEHVVAGGGARMVFAFPVSMTRIEADDTAFGGPYGRTIYHGGVTVRYSKPISCETDLALFDDGWQPDQAPTMRHVLLPLLWSWAYGAKAGAPMHPAGELRWLFIADQEGP